jgi:hypothetical protein
MIWLITLAQQAKREIAERQRAMAEFNQEIETTPVFQVFAGTTKMRGLWYPVAAFKADNVAKGVVDAYLTEGFVSNMFKDVYKAQVGAHPVSAYPTLNLSLHFHRFMSGSSAVHVYVKSHPQEVCEWLRGVQPRSPCPELIIHSLAC